MAQVPTFKVEGPGPLLPPTATKVGTWATLEVRKIAKFGNRVPIDNARCVPHAQVPRAQCPGPYLRKFLGGYEAGHNAQVPTLPRSLP